MYLVLPNYNRATCTHICFFFPVCNFNAGHSNSFNMTERFFTLDGAVASVCWSPDTPTGIFSLYISKHKHTYTKAFLEGCMSNYYCSQNPAKGWAMFHLEVGGCFSCVCTCVCDVPYAASYVFPWNWQGVIDVSMCNTSSQVKNSSCGATGGIALTQLVSSASSSSSSTRARTCIFPGHPISPPEKRWRGGKGCIWKERLTGRWFMILFKEAAIFINEEPILWEMFVALLLWQWVITKKNRIKCGETFREADHIWNKKEKMYSGCRKINTVSVGAFCVCKALNKTRPMGPMGVAHLPSVPRLQFSKFPNTQLW